MERRVTSCLTPAPPAPCPCHRVDNNHLLLLMIHVFRENEEQLFKVSPRTGEPWSNTAKACWVTQTVDPLTAHAVPQGRRAG